MARERDSANNGRDVSQDALARMAIRNTQMKVKTHARFRKLTAEYPHDFSCVCMLDLVFSLSSQYVQRGLGGWERNRFRTTVVKNYALKRRIVACPFLVSRTPTDCHCKWHARTPALLLLDRENRYWLGVAHVFFLFVCGTITTTTTTTTSPKPSRASLCD